MLPDFTPDASEPEITQHGTAKTERAATAAIEDYCLWEMESLEFKVGIVGTGPGFVTILDIISNELYHDFLPMMRLVAVAETADPRKAALVRNKHIPVYETCGEMLEAHPEIGLLIELVGNRFKARRLRQNLPDEVSLVDHVAAVFFCGMHNMLQAGQHCRKDLDRHKALLRAVMDEVNEDILLLDKERRVVDMNKNIRERLAATPKGTDLTMGKACWLIQTDEAGECFCQSGPDPNCPYDTTLSSGKKAEALITRVNEQGQLVYYRVYSYPVHDSTGHMTHILLLRRNITARTMRERHQQQLDKMALLGELSGYLAHEIRNPLFAISGFTRSLMRSDNLNDEEREKLTIISEETKRLDHMLKSMLDFSRSPGIKVAECDINRVAQQTVDIMRMGYASRGYKLDIQTERSLPTAKGEAEAIKQCLVNLIKNSMEAMPEGGEISITTGIENDKVFIRVKDKGAGISPEAMEKVFSPFYSTKSQSYGMGLAMIKKTVDEFGGDVQLSSSQGKGAAVTMYFQPILEGAHSTNTPLTDAPEDTQ